MKQGLLSKSQRRASLSASCMVSPRPLRVTRRSSTGSRTGSSSSSMFSISSGRPSDKHSCALQADHYRMCEMQQ